MTSTPNRPCAGTHRSGLARRGLTLGVGLVTAVAGVVVAPAVLAAPASAAIPSVGTALDRCVVAWPSP